MTFIGPWMDRRIVCLALILCAAASAIADSQTLTIKKVTITRVAFLEKAHAGGFILRSFDLNGDGLDDFIATNEYNGDIDVYIATTAPPQQVFVELESRSFSYHLPFGPSFIADFDRDEFRDLFARVEAGIAVINDAAGPTPGVPTLMVPGNFINDPQGMAAADVDGDGDDDIIVNQVALAGNPSPTCFVYRNDTPVGQDAAPGNFILADTIFVTPAPMFAQEFSSVSTGLINADAIPDLALANVLSGKCYLMAGIGDGTFDPIDPATGLVIAGGATSQGEINVGANAFKGLLEDLDGDGATDLTALRVGTQHTVRFGNGDGTFDPAQLFTGPGNMQFPIAGDTDGNGTKDIVTIINTSTLTSDYDSFTVTLVNLDQTLQETQTFPTLYQPASAAFFRLDNDEEPALLVGGDGKVALHRNFAGALGSFSRFLFSGTGGARDIAVGDLTGDGYRDVYYSTFTSHNRVLVNSGDGSGAVGATVIPAQNFMNAEPVVFVDRPAVGKGVIVIPDDFSSGLFIGEMNAGNTQLQYNAFVAYPADVSDAASADFDDDGDEDIILLHSTSNPGISIVPQQADGSFSETATSFDLSADEPAEGWWTECDEWDVGTTESLAVTGPGGAGIFLDNGSGFDFYSAFSAGFSGGVRIAAGDLNGDSRADLVVGRDLGSNTGALAISIQITGSSPPTFAAPVTISVSGVSRSLEIADLDNDGDEDVVALCDDGATGLQRSIILLNEGSGQFPDVDTSHHIAGQQPTRLRLADLHNAVGSLRGGGSPATAGPDFVLGSRGPNAYAGLQVHANIVDFTPPCEGDADGSGVVNFGDVLTVLANFGVDYSPNSGLGDADGNSLVNFTDILSVLANFGAVCP